MSGPFTLKRHDHSTERYSDNFQSKPQPGQEALSKEWAALRAAAELTTRTAPSGQAIPLTTKLSISTQSAFRRWCPPHQTALSPSRLGRDAVQVAPRKRRRIDPHFECVLTLSDLRTHNLLEKDGKFLSPWCHNRIITTFRQLTAAGHSVKEIFPIRDREGAILLADAIKNGMQRKIVSTYAASYIYNAMNQLHPEKEDLIEYFSAIAPGRPCGKK